jgi:hypothetical protein
MAHEFSLLKFSTENENTQHGSRMTQSYAEVVIKCSCPLSSMRKVKLFQEKAKQMRDSKRKIIIDSLIE